MDIIVKGSIIKEIKYNNKTFKFRGNPTYRDLPEITHIIEDYSDMIDTHKVVVSDDVSSSGKRLEIAERLTETKPPEDIKKPILMKDGVEIMVKHFSSLSLRERIKLVHENVDGVMSSNDITNKLINKGYDVNARAVGGLIAWSKCCTNIQSSPPRRFTKRLESDVYIVYDTTRAELEKVIKECPIHTKPRDILRKCDVDLVHVHVLAYALIVEIKAELSSGKEPMKDERVKFCLVDFDKKCKIEDVGEQLLRDGVLPSEAIKQLRDKFPDVILSDTILYKWKRLINREKESERKDKETANPPGIQKGLIDFGYTRKDIDNEIWSTIAIDYMTIIKKNEYVSDIDIRPDDRDVFKNLEDDNLIECITPDKGNQYWMVTPEGEKVLKE